MKNVQSAWHTVNVKYFVKTLLPPHCFFFKEAIPFYLPEPQPLQWLRVSPLQYTFIQTFHEPAKMFSGSNPSLANEVYAFVPHMYIFLPAWTIAKLIVLVLCKISAEFKVILLSNIF